MRVWLVLSLLFVVLMVRFLLFYSQQKSYTDGQQLSFETTLLSEPTASGNTQRFSLKPDQKQQIAITTLRFPELHYGDSISVSGIVKKRVVQGKRVLFVLQYPIVTQISKQNSFDLLAIPISLASFCAKKLYCFSIKTYPKLKAIYSLVLYLGLSCL